ncbi:T9SS type A sorting domain-containing protein [Aridibaculum aurantiacum]|uniref:T9SS type A sorting domain-containing protein n=1 Tax=Aridibaculum aurantiacum TaxID=2810307 RepID=UPI001A9594C9|nr:T9SS type A sorting domain-containing protein [Aridibaculum aurantiacum]
MKQLYLALVALALTFTSVHAQMNYHFSAVQGTYSPLVGGIVPTVENAQSIYDTHDEGFANNIPIGFNFTYEGNSYTQIHANTNGFAAFRPFTQITDHANHDYYTADLGYGPYGRATQVRPILAPLWDDHDLFSTSDIKYLTTGTAPNRVFTLQWSRVYWDASASQLNIEFQLKLYETTNVVEFHYNRLPGALGSNPTAAIGITSTGTGPGAYIALSDASANPTASQFTNYYNISTKPATGQVYRFTSLCANDNTPPVISMNDVQEVFSNSSNPTYYLSPFNLAQITDNCDVNHSNTTVTPTSINCSSPGDATRRVANVAPYAQGNQAFYGSLGTPFEVKNLGGIYLTSLGAFDHNGDGIRGTQDGGIRVGIFDEWGFEVAQTIIKGNAEGIRGNYRFKAIHPVLLRRGRYVVVAKGYNDTELAGNAGIHGVGSYPAGDLGGGAIAYSGTSTYGNNDSTGGFTVPTNGDATANRYQAGTFEYYIGGGGETTLFTIRAEDINGNPAQKQGYVTLYCNPLDCTNDTIAPVVTTLNTSIHTNSNGVATINKFDVIDNVTDNCSIHYDSVFVSQTQFTCNNPVGADATLRQAASSNTSTGNQDFGGELGIPFTVNAANGIVINRLAAFDHNGDGINGTINGGVRVAIFSLNVIPFSKYANLDVTIVGNADGISGGYRYKNVSPVHLPPGNYIIVAKGYNANELNGNLKITGTNTNSNVDLGNGAISFTGNSRYGEANPATFTYPSNPDSYPNQYLAGSFFYSKPGSQDYTVTVTAKDNAGNIGQATATVTVICSGQLDPCANDVTPPTIVSKDITVTAGSNGSATIQPSDVIESVTDNCAVNTNSYSVTPSVFTCTGGGDATPRRPIVSPSNQGNQAFTGELGTPFRVNGAGIMINQLGAFDHLGDGINGTQNGGVRVAIFNANTRSIVQGLDVIVSGNGENFINNFRFVRVNPVMLPMGDYVVVAKGYSSNEMNGNAAIAGIGSYPAGDLGNGAVSYNGNSMYGAMNSNSSFTYPGNPDGTPNRYLAGNFIYSIPAADTVTVTITAQDINGNTGQQTARVAVICPPANPCTNDTQGPTIVPKDVTVRADANGNATIQASDVVESVTDNCTVSSIQLSQSQFTCSGGGGSSSPTRQAIVAPTSTGNQDFYGAMGTPFSVNASSGIVVNQLGAFDHNGDGIQGSIRVAIFNTSTGLIVQGLDATISGLADGVVGGFRVKNVTGVFLPQGNYIVVAKGFDGVDMNGNAAIGGSGSYPAGDLGGGAISYNGPSAHELSNDFKIPSNPDATSNRYLAGSFSYRIPTPDTYQVTITATDPSGNQSTATATVNVVCQQGGARTTSEKQAIVSLQEVGKSNAVRVVPNPSNGRFTLQLANLSVQKVTVQVLTQSGMLVEQKAVNLTGNTALLSVPFDLTRQPAGMYFVKVISADGVQTQKVVIQR